MKLQTYRRIIEKAQTSDRWAINPGHDPDRPQRDTDGKFPPIILKYSMDKTHDQNRTRT